MHKMSGMGTMLLAMAALTGCASQPALRHAYDPAQAEGQSPARIETRPGLAIIAVDDYNSCNFPLFCSLPQAVMVLPGEHTLHLRYTSEIGAAQGVLTMQAAPGGQYRVGYEVKGQRYVRFLVEAPDTAAASPAN